MNQAFGTDEEELQRVLHPIPHELLDDIYRVPVRHKDKKYTVYLGNNTIRMYRDEALPINIRAKITMANASLDEKVIPRDVDTHYISLFIFKKGLGINEVCYKASETMYIVFLDELELKELEI